MKNVIDALFTEALKLRRTKMFWIMFLLFVFIPFMMSMLLFVAKNPEAAGEFGLTGSKAGMMQIGIPGWESYFKLLLQGITGVGIVGTGFVASWVFGREFAQHTVKDLLALPVSRTTVVIAKFILVIIWGLLLSVIFFLSGLFFGWVIGLTGLTTELFSQYSSTHFTASLIMVHLSSVAALLASSSRGYMLPIGVIILMLILANFSGMLGIGPYFPWAIPGLFATDKLQLVTASYIIVTITCLCGYIGTVFFWRYADHK